MFNRNVVLHVISINNISVLPLGDIVKQKRRLSFKIEYLLPKPYRNVQNDLHYHIYFT